MNLKEIFQPTKLKIIIAILLFLVLPLIPISVQCAGDCPLFELISGFVFFPIAINGISQMISGATTIAARELPNLIISGILAFTISYVASCLVITLYKKVKK